MSQQYLIDTENGKFLVLDSVVIDHQIKLVVAEPIEADQDGRLHFMGGQIRVIDTKKTVFRGFVDAQVTLPMMQMGPPPGPPQKRLLRPVP